METEYLIEILLFSSVFLIATSLILALAKRYSFPYTALLLLSGFAAQYVLHILKIPFHFGISTDFIYFFLLPLLLFESALHINFHQFKLQFKTITFLSTFGLLVSIGVVAVIASFFAGLPWEIGLLFGALISATDPIAVLSIFKNLGAPKRLALLADGESMFNDATGVIAYRVIAAAVIGGSALGASETIAGIGSFTVIFLGSIGFGALCANLMSLLIHKVDNDRLVETTMTIALAIGSFVAAEHFFHLSGVISTVTAGIVMGNLGKTRISVSVHQFMDELWEYVGFIALSVVFFFSTFTLELASLFHQFGSVLIIIASVLIARAVSVYLSCFITNSSRFFSNEPNVPLAWQHILQWGGLRGVIPLVLVYSIPDSFAYKTVLLQYTLATFLFTSFVNAITIDKLLIRLGLHLRKKEEEIVNIEESIFEIEQVKKRIESLNKADFDHSVIHEVTKKAEEKEKSLKKHLIEMASPAEFEQSIRLQAVHIERQTIDALHTQGHISERVYFEFDSELDLQQDALEHPDVLKNSRAVRTNGTIDSSAAFRTQLIRLGDLLRSFPVLRLLAWKGKDELIFSRLALLQARIQASSDVIDYANRIHALVKEKHVFAQIIDTVRSEHEHYRLRNAYQMQIISREESKLYKEFQAPLVDSYTWMSKVE